MRERDLVRERGKAVCEEVCEGVGEKDEGWVYVKKKGGFKRGSIISHGKTIPSRNGVPHGDHRGYSNQVEVRGSGSGSRVRASKEFITFFFSNFPDEVRHRDLWVLFGRLGVVGEIVIPPKRDVRGKRFGFVRFKRFFDPIGVFSRLNDLWIGSFKLFVKRPLFGRDGHPVLRVKNPFTCALEGVNKVAGPLGGVWNSNAPLAKKIGSNSFNGETSLKRFGSYAQAFPSLSKDALVFRCNGSPPLEGDINEAYVGFLKKSGEEDTVVAALAEFGALSIRAISLDSKKIVMWGENNANLEDIFNSKDTWWKWFFEKVSPWNSSIFASDRKVWIKCLGIPLFAWNPCFFKEFVAHFGELIKVSDDTLYYKRLDSCTLQIRSCSWDFIAFKCKTVIGKDSFDVSIVEIHDMLEVGSGRKVLSMESDSSNVGNDDSGDEFPVFESVSPSLQKKSLGSRRSDGSLGVDSQPLLSMDGLPSSSHVSDTLPLSLDDNVSISKMLQKPSCSGEKLSASDTAVGGGKLFECFPIPSKLHVDCMESSLVPFQKTNALNNKVVGHAVVSNVNSFLAPCSVAAKISVPSTSSMIPGPVKSVGIVCARKQNLCHSDGNFGESLKQNSLDVCERQGSVGFVANPLNVVGPTSLPCSILGDPSLSPRAAQTTLGLLREREVVEEDGDTLHVEDGLMLSHLFKGGVNINGMKEHEYIDKELGSLHCGVGPNISPTLKCLHERCMEGGKVSSRHSSSMDLKVVDFCNNSKVPHALPSGPKGFKNLGTFLPTFSHTKRSSMEGCNGVFQCSKALELELVRSNKISNVDNGVLNLEVGDSSHFKKFTLGSNEQAKSMCGLEIVKESLSFGPFRESCGTKGCKENFAGCHKAFNEVAPLKQKDEDKQSGCQDYTSLSKEVGHFDDDRMGKGVGDILPKLNHVIEGGELEILKASTLSIISPKLKHVKEGVELEKLKGSSPSFCQSKIKVCKGQCIIDNGPFSNGLLTCSLLKENQEALGDKNLHFQPSSQLEKLSSDDGFGLVKNLGDLFPRPLLQSIGKNCSVETKERYSDSEDNISKMESVETGPPGFLLEDQLSRKLVIDKRKKNFRKSRRVWPSPFDLPLKRKFCRIPIPPSRQRGVLMSNKRSSIPSKILSTSKKSLGVVISGNEAAPLSYSLAEDNKASKILDLVLNMGVTPTSDLKSVKEKILIAEKVAKECGSRQTTRDQDGVL